VAELIAELMVSVDGYAGSERSPGYFGYPGPDLQRWIDDEDTRPHRQVMGRKTYSMLAELPEEARDASWERMTETDTLVFSRTLEDVSWPGATLVREDARDVLPALKADGDTDMRIVGSLSLVQQLLNAGHVDRLRLLVFPLVLGETGREPAYARLHDTALDLLSQRVLDDRILLCDYRPAGPPPYAG
jgi:dihydrofolate reductase